MDNTSAELMESLMFVAFTGREGTEDLRAHLNQAAEFEVSGTARICGHHPIKRVKPRGGDRV